MKLIPVRSEQAAVVAVGFDHAFKRLEAGGDGSLKLTHPLEQLCELVGDGPLGRPLCLPDRRCYALPPVLESGLLNGLGQLDQSRRGRDRELTLLVSSEDDRVGEAQDLEALSTLRPDTTTSAAAWSRQCRKRIGATLRGPAPDGASRGHQRAVRNRAATRAPRTREVSAMQKPGSITVHNDRRAPMTASGFVDLLAQLGVERSKSRPRVSNDNPFSESCFKTIKYQPDYPGRFRDVAHARRWFIEFFDWYANQHRHSGLALFSPADVFFARVAELAGHRQRALDAAYAARAERFVRGRPTVRLPPAKVAINPTRPRRCHAERRRRAQRA